MFTGPKKRANIRCWSRMDLVSWKRFLKAFAVERLNRVLSRWQGHSICQVSLILLASRPGPFTDILISTPYSFHPKSFAEVNSEHRSQHSAWETPDPAFWTSHEYVVLRVDERGCGQSPGMLDSMSSTTSDGFFDVVEWAAQQPWSTGKVGLLGISYYAGSQWRVAARKPKGLAAMIPWEGK